MVRVLVLAALAALPLAGCGVPGGERLVSTQTRPGTGLVGSASEPQPVNSLPPGAAGRPQRGPFASAPDYLSVTFGR
jgi:hypothetical protein